MKTVIICISDPYLVRGRQLSEYYRKRGDETLILTPDFSHRMKQRITTSEESVILLPHPAYKRNLSAARMFGHYLFSKECLKALEEIRPDRIHCLIPANSLASAMKRYKTLHPEVCLVLDVQDLWPESFPVPFIRHFPGYGLWKRMRTGSIDAADCIVTECEYYRGKIGAALPERIHTLYWSKEDCHPDLECRWNDDEIHLAYLGSMNHILDIEGTCDLLDTLCKSRPVVLHLIGSGERKAEFVLRLKRIGNLQILDHGEIYDNERKQRIFNGCRFGLNLMKSHIQVALSMKSIDYFQSGLPVLNNLAGDTGSLIERESAGFNLPEDSAKRAKVIRRILDQSEKDNLRMRKNARSLYESRFSTKSFERKLDEIFRPDLEAGSQEMNKAGETNDRF